MTDSYDKLTILITGARAPIALELARSFAKQGHRVILADSLRLVLSRWSNCVSKFYYLPSPRYAEKKFISALQEIVLKEKIDHLIPTCEEAFYLAFHKNEFECKVWTASGQLMMNLHNKQRFHQFAGELLPIPETVSVAAFSDWVNSRNYVFKPVYSRFASATIIGQKLGENYFSDKRKDDWIAQKLIRGKEICIYSLWDQGTLKAFGAYHPLFRAGKGAGIFFEPVSNNKVFEYVRQFGTHISYTGQLCFDVIIDQDDEAHFIECNPRGTSGAHLIHSHLANCFLKDQFFEAHENHSFSLKYALLLFHPRSFFGKTIRNSTDVIFKSSDPKPFFLQFLSLFEFAYIKFRKRKSWLQATTDDMEWNG